MHIITSDSSFPSPESATDDGLLAIGGDLTTERLLLAYKNGIFPWFNDDEPILWWCPDPRFILIPSELKISKSMRPVLNNGTFKFRVNTAFEEVINNCKNANRKDQPGTWITDEVREAFINLHKCGYAVSAEAWKNGELAGGVYGVLLGKVFFEESMFSKQPNASKFAFISYIKYLQKQQVQLIDCQVYTSHLQTLGARMIERENFLQLLTTLIS